MYLHIHKYTHTYVCIHACTHVFKCAQWDVIILARRLGLESVVSLGIREAAGAAFFFQPPMGASFSKPEDAVRRLPDNESNVTLNSQIKESAHMHTEVHTDTRIHT